MFHPHDNDTTRSCVIHLSTFVAQYSVPHTRQRHDAFMCHSSQHVCSTVQCSIHSTVFHTLDNDTTRSRVIHLSTLVAQYSVFHPLDNDKTRSCVIHLSTLVAQYSVPSTRQRHDAFTCHSSQHVCSTVQCSIHSTTTRHVHVSFLSARL